MALTLNTFTTGLAIGNREDLSDIIYRISPTQTPVLSMAAKAKPLQLPMNGKHKTPLVHRPLPKYRI